MKRIMIYAAAAAVLLAFSGPSWRASARAAQAHAAGFTCNGDRITGWQWLRSPGHTATWTFRTADFRGATRIYLNFAPLVTNGASGGSGFGTSCRVSVTGATTTGSSIPLTNAFAPQDPESSNGIGYQCYGHSGPIAASVYEGVAEITVTVSYPFASGRHLAVNAESMHVGFSR